MSACVQTCVQTSGSHESHANTGANSDTNYANHHISITTTLPTLHALTTLNSADIGIDGYVANCHNQAIKTNPVSQTLSSNGVPSSPSSSANPPFIEIPFGWRRELIDGRMVYYSPTNCLLQSVDELSAYLESEGTCKCGLECPLHISRAFSFDVCVVSKPYDIEVAKSSNQNKLCNHKRKIIAFATYREQQLIAEQQLNQNHNQLHKQHIHSDITSNSHLSSHQLSASLNTKHLKLQQRHDIQSAQHNDSNVLNLSHLFNHNSNSCQINVTKYANDSLIDTVSTLHSNQNLAKFGHQLSGAESLVSQQQFRHNCSNGLQDSPEKQTIIGSHQLQPQYIQQTPNCDNRCQYSVQMTGDYIPQAAANSFCLYGQNGNNGVYSFSACDSTQITVNPNDKTSIYLTPHNQSNYGQMISYDNTNVDIIQSSHPQTFTSDTFSHPFQSSPTVCNSNITTIPSAYIPLPSADNCAANSGALSFGTNSLSTNTITLNPTYHSGLQTSHDTSHCNPQNNISILSQNASISPMPPLSVPNNITSVTSSVTDVIPAVGVAPQIINSNNTSGAPQVLQFINSVPLTQITANTVTVLQQAPAPEVPATTLIIPQLMQQHDHQMVINHTMTSQPGMYPHIATAAGLTALPNAFQNAINIANAISLPQRTCIPESTKPFTRTRRRKEYNRTNRSHPPTVASILKQAADNEKKQKAIELNERQRSEHKDQESQTICDTNDTNCETNETTDITELSSE